MKPLNFKGSSFTPIVKLNYEEGTLEIKGRAVIEDPAIYFKPVTDWIMEYVTKPQKTTTLNLNLDYMNTGFVIILQQIILEFQQIKENGFNVIINWYYDNDDEYSKEVGEEMALTTSMQINSIGLKPEIYDNEFEWLFTK